MGHRTAGTARAAVALLCLTACTSSSGETETPTGSTGSPGSAAVVRGSDAAEPAHEVLVRGRVTRVAGQLSGARRERVARQARAVVEEYLEGAFTDGGAKEAFAGFLPGLRRAARADASVLRGTEGTGPVRASVWFSVAAPHGRAVGVTARVAVDLPGSGGERPALTGRLLLTEERGRWRVFGYDLARAAGR